MTEEGFEVTSLPLLLLHRLGRKELHWVPSLHSMAQYSETMDWKPEINQPSKRATEPVQSNEKFIVGIKEISND